MLQTLLATRLYFPPARPVLVPRPRLVERLQALWQDGQHPPDKHGGCMPGLLRSRKIGVFLVESKSKISY